MPSDPPIPAVSEPIPPPPAPPPVTQSPSKPVTPKASVTITQSGTSSTPTLKIRLPRLSAVSATTHSNLTLPTLQSPPFTLSPAPDTTTSHDSRPRRSSRRQDSVSVSVSGASSYTAEVVEDVELAKPSKQQTSSFCQLIIFTKNASHQEETEGMLNQHELAPASVRSLESPWRTASAVAEARCEAASGPRGGRASENPVLDVERYIYLVIL